MLSKYIWKVSERYYQYDLSRIKYDHPFRSDECVLSSFPKVIVSFGQLTVWYSETPRLNWLLTQTMMAGHSIRASIFSNAGESEAHGSIARALYIPLSLASIYSLCGEAATTSCAFVSSYWYRSREIPLYGYQICYSYYF